jgi:hypothetical protein
MPGTDARFVRDFRRLARAPYDVGKQLTADERVNKGVLNPFGECSAHV